MSSTHFGFQQVDESQKAQRVRGVFDSVANKYDVMNDLMSMGLHRLGKAYAIAASRSPVPPAMSSTFIPGLTAARPIVKDFQTLCKPADIKSFITS